jgi:hypothetical protein
MYKMKGLFFWQFACLFRLACQVQVITVSVFTMWTYVCTVSVITPVSQILITSNIITMYSELIGLKFTLICVIFFL